MLILIDTYKHFDPRTIKNSNTTLELLEVKTTKNWSKNLKDVPAIENYDVMIYLYNSVSSLG